MDTLPAEPEELKQDIQVDQQDATGDRDQQTFGNGDNGMGSNGWDQRRGDNHGDMGFEHDSHGTGIKEDG